MTVNNRFYESTGNTWWSDEASFAYTSLRYCVNPARYRYFLRVIAAHPAPGRAVLDIGCGGGFLAESFARDGWQVSGVDPAATSIEAARAHATLEGLTIDYRVGRGESLPFSDDSFDIVACCDVLEHVDDVRQVVAEASRTLKPGGLFLFDTVNRTRKSRFAMITVWQDWDLLGLGVEDLHDWTKFVTPDELSGALTEHGLAVADLTGLAPTRNPLTLAWTFLAIRRGRLRNEALASALPFAETRDLSVSYIGWASKAA